MRLDVEAVLDSLADERGRARHVLVAAVGAAADEAHLELGGPVVLLGSLSELGQGGGEIGREGAVDVGLELRQVDLDNLIVLGTGISLQVLLERVGEAGG